MDRTARQSCSADRPDDARRRSVAGGARLCAAARVLVRPAAVSAARGRRRGQLYRSLHDGVQRLHRLVVLRLPARLGLRQGDGRQRRGRQRRAVGGAAIRRAACAGRRHRRVRSAHVWRCEPVRRRLLGVSARPRAVPRGRPAAAVHPRHHRLRLGHLHDDFRGLAGDPELDPDAVPGHDALCRVAGQSRRRGGHGHHWFCLAQVDDRPLDHRGRTLRRA